VTIAGHEVELRDLKNAAHCVMNCITLQVKGAEQKSILDRLIETPDRLLTLLDALVRVKSHYPDVDMVKVKGGADAEKTSRP
jgi:hypothetical protein